MSLRPSIAEADRPNGLAIAAPVCERSERIETTVDRATFAALTRSGQSGRMGPVFLEIPLDVQGARVDEATLSTPVPAFVPSFRPIPEAMLTAITAKLAKAQRPVILLGAGVARETAEALLPQLASRGVPLMVTWNATDRVPADHPCYFGRPNTWGQRYANILMQQADVLLALGTRLGLQQTGFNWQRFIPAGEVVQVDCDESELTKGHPKVALAVCGDANAVLRAVAAAKPNQLTMSAPPSQIAPRTRICVPPQNRVS